MDTIIYIGFQDDEIVEPEDGCPGCGERRMDWLLWVDDGTSVHCATCGTVYEVPEVRPC